MYVVTDGHPDPKIGPQVYLGPIKSTSTHSYSFQVGQRAKDGTKCPIRKTSFFNNSISNLLKLSNQVSREKRILGGFVSSTSR